MTCIEPTSMEVRLRNWRPCPIAPPPSFDGPPTAPDCASPLRTKVVRFLLSGRSHLPEETSIGCFPFGAVPTLKNAAETGLPMESTSFFRLLAAASPESGPSVKKCALRRPQIHCQFN